MTERFFFDLVNGHETIRDEEGAEAADLQEATQQAQAVLQEMRQAGELNGETGPWEMVIRTVDGGVYRSIAIV